MLRALRASDQEEIAYRVRLISEFPEMYPVRSHQPYAGFRYFFAKDWCVSYTMADDAIIILAIFALVAIMLIKKRLSKPEQSEA